MQTAIPIVGLGILAVIAYGDMRSRRIPNVLSLAIAILGLLRIMLVHDPVTAGHTLAAGVAIFTAGFFLFWHGAIGAGDAKLGAAAALLVGYQNLFGFLFLMSLCGGVVASPVSRRKGSICLSDVGRGDHTYPQPARAIEIEWRQKGRQCLMASLSPLLA